MVFEQPSHRELETFIYTYRPKYVPGYWRDIKQWIIIRVRFIRGENFREIRALGPAFTKKKFASSKIINKSLGNEVEALINSQD